MGNEFTKVMVNQSDEQLIKIITIQRKGFQPLAIEAAEKELEKRGIDISNLDSKKLEFINAVERQNWISQNRVDAGTRFIHFMVDTMVVVMCMWVLSLFTGLFYDGDDIGKFKIIIYCIYVVAFLSYYIIMEHIYQKTLAKFITNTKVVNLKGDKPELGDIIRRTFYRLLPLDRISFLFSRNGFHDYLSNTGVIKDRD